MGKSITIIGAGIAGLSAGCYGQMNGYRTRIFEMDTKPGGVCTSWKRKGYTIDGCLHWLVGSGPASNFYRIWEELGIIQNHTFVDHDEYLRIEGKDGKSFALYSDLDRLEKCRPPVEIRLLPSQGGREVEAEPVDVHLLDPVSQTLQDEL